MQRNLRSLVADVVPAELTVPDLQVELVDELAAAYRST